MPRFATEYWFKDFSGTISFENKTRGDVRSKEFIFANSGGRRPSDVFIAVLIGLNACPHDNSKALVREGSVIRRDARLVVPRISVKNMAVSCTHLSHFENLCAVITPRSS